MKTREQSDLENLALSAELSRQLAHDFNNFLYNLLLQIEICEKLAKAQPPDWSRIKQENRKMAARLQQWQRFHNRFSPAPPSKIDVHQLVQHVVGDSAAAQIPVSMEPSITPDALWITSTPMEVSHLLRLLLEATLHACQESAPGDPKITIRIDRIDEKVIVRIQARDKSLAPSMDPEGYDERTLVEAACQSLAIRVDATIRRERGKGIYTIAVELPLALTENR